jgi:ECF transporter S component (folate family)
LEQNKKNGVHLREKKIPVFISLEGLCLSGILAAMSIVLGKFLQIPNPFQDFIRISFENLPIILGGIAIGPLAAMLIGVVADLTGCVLYGYSINPIITLGAAAVGLVSGLMGKYIVKGPLILQIIASVMTSHIIGSVLIKSYGLAVWYLDKYSLGYWEFVAWRLLNYVIVGTLEGILLYVLFKNKAFRNQMEKISRK